MLFRHFVYVIRPGEVLGHLFVPEFGILQEALFIHLVRSAVHVKFWHCCFPPHNLWLGLRPRPQNFPAPVWRYLTGRCRPVCFRYNVFSMASAIPIPPLMQSVAKPRWALRLSISWSSVTVMRVPVQPIG
jgi:hypothetical protein